MKKLSIIYIIVFFLFSCNSKSEKSGIEKENEESSLTKIPTKSKVNNSIIEEQDKSKEKRIEFDFLSGCDSLEIWHGGIQGTNKNSLTCCYIMAQCFANKHFDLIVYSDKDIGISKGSIFKKNRIVDNLDNATYFVFEIPKKLPKEPENEFDTFDYIYPSNVRIYKKFDDGWYLINTKKIESFEQLGELKLNTLLNETKKRP